MDLLAGVRVVSFNHFLAGPIAAQVLGDLGADVIAVEPIEGAFQRNWAVANHFVAGQSVNLIATGRNKRSLAVDLKSDDGHKLIAQILKNADVVMENFRPGTMARLGFGYEQIKADNPRVIYAAATGFGSDGPYPRKLPTIPGQVGPITCDKQLECIGFDQPASGLAPILIEELLAAQRICLCSRPRPAYSLDLRRAGGNQRLSRQGWLISRIISI